MRGARLETHDDELDEIFPERRNYVVDFYIEFVGAEQRSPAAEDGMGDFKNASIGLGVTVGKFGN